jgi:transcriptional regulator with XRE-family HTH domain
MRADSAQISRVVSRDADKKTEGVRKCLLAERHRGFGRYLREKRQAKRLNIRDFAKRVGLAAGHLSNLENGRAGPPSADMIHKMAEVLDVPVGELLARSGRLSPEGLQRFWSLPMIPALVQASEGWSHEEAAIFQESVLASMNS